MAISPANQDIATSDAIKLAREVDPTGILKMSFMLVDFCLLKCCYAIKILSDEQGD